jgi:hypothetical protein
MVPKGRAAVAAAVAAVLLSGCGGTTKAGAPAPQAPAKPASAGAVLAKAVQLLRTDGTGAFDAVTTSMAAGFLQTRQVGGSYDLARNRWAGTVDVQVSAVGKPHVGGFAAKLAGRDKTLFVNVGKGAKGVQGVSLGKLDAGQWYRTRANGLPFAAADLSGLGVLSRVEATEVRPSSSGGQVVTGTLSAADAVDLLGLAQEVRRLKVRPKALAGSALVTVYLDEAGRPVRIRVSGDDVTFTGRAPVELRDLVEAATYAQTFHSLGDPVTIAVPRKATAAGPLAAAARSVL